MIPSHQYKAIDEISKCQDEYFEGIFHAFEKQQASINIEKFLRGVKRDLIKGDIASDAADSIISFLGSLTQGFANSDDIDIPSYVDYIIDVIEIDLESLANKNNLDSEIDFQSSDISILRDRLIRFLSDAKSLAITLKASRCAYDYPNLLRDFKVNTNIRPVDYSDLGKRLFVSSYTMKITVENEKYNDIHILIDSDDIEFIIDELTKVKEELNQTRKTLTSEMVSFIDM